MKEVPLTRGYVALVDDDDYERVMQFRWQAKPCARTVYATRTIWLSRDKSTSVTMHRFILGISDAATGVDHRNHDGLDNTRTNLRIASKYDNARNQRKRAESTAPYKGIIWERRKKLWRARIVVNSKRVGLGRFKDPIDAARAYDSAAWTHYGEFAALNFPQGVQ